MTLFKMNRRIVRFVSTQKKFIARSTAPDHHQIVLYNEMPQKSKSLIINIDDTNGKEVLEYEEFKTIRSNRSRILFLFNTNLIVLYKGPPENTIPLTEGGTVNEIPTVRIVDLLRWFAKSKDSDDKSPIQPGGRLGRLDAANEAGFFHRTDRSRLKEIKKKLKDKGEEDPIVPKKTE